MLDNRTVLLRSVAILTAIAEVDRPIPESFAYIPFSEDGLDAFYVVVDTMVSMGWIKRGAGSTLAITPEGRETAARVEATIAARKATVAKPKGGRIMGSLLWRGPSAIDGASLIVVATTGTDNGKTGDMIQTWILREDIAPHDAVASGADASICGSCYHRGAPDRPRTCYVNVGQAPLSVWRAYHRGRYSADAELPDVPVRIGAYGDPAAVPISVWWPFVQRGRWTGYTHRWRECSQGYAAFLMASCETAADVRDARARGWRAFCTLQTDGAIECPSARGVKCADCRLCAGTEHARAPSIWIAPHGSASRFVPGGGA